MLPYHHSNYTLSDRSNNGVHWRVLIASFFFVISISSGYFIITGNILNPEPYYVYYGTKGPYRTNLITSNTDPESTEYVIGENSSKFKAGDWISFISDITIEKNVIVLSSWELYSVKTERVVAKQDFVQNVTERRMGPKTFYYKIPDDLPPGPYELRRSSVYNPKNNYPVSKIFPSIVFEVG